MENPFLCKETVAQARRAIDRINGSVPLAKASDDISINIVKPTSSGEKFKATVNDVSRQRAWSGQGSTESEASTEAVRGFLNDRRAPEYVGKR